MSERTEYAPGEFCWVDLATTDVTGAKDSTPACWESRRRTHRAIRRRPVGTGSS